MSYNRSPYKSVTIVDVLLGAAMACNAVATSVTNMADTVSGSGRRYETGCGIPPGGCSGSSSPDCFHPELETTSSLPGEDSQTSRLLQTLTPPSSAYTGERRYSSVRHSWYPQSTNYYTVAATGYPAQTGSRPQTTWPEITNDDVKPTSFVLSSPPNECNANYCSERYIRFESHIILYSLSGVFRGPCAYPRPPPPWR